MKVLNLEGNKNKDLFRTELKRVKTRFAKGEKEHEQLGSSKNIRNQCSLLHLTTYKDNKTRSQKFLIAQLRDFTGKIDKIVKIFKRKLHNMEEAIAT